MCDLPNKVFYTHPFKPRPETIVQTIYETKVPCISLLVKSEMAVFQLLGSNLSSLSSLTENRWIFLNREWPQRSEPNIKKIWDDFRWLYKSTHGFFSAPRKNIWNGGWVQMTCPSCPVFQIFGGSPIFEVKQLRNQQISSQIFADVSFLHFQQMSATNCTHVTFEVLNIKSLFCLTGATIVLIWKSMDTETSRKPMIFFLVKSY